MFVNSSYLILRRNQKETSDIVLGNDSGEFG